MNVIPQAPEQVDLEIHVGSDLTFDIEWYESDETTGINIASFESQVRDASDEVLLDLVDYATIDENVIHVNVPASVTENLPGVLARWDLDVTAQGSGEVRKIARGRALIRTETSRGEVS